MKSFLLFIICILLHLSVFGQTRTVRSILYDKENRNHIEGVSITPDFFENDSIVNSEKSAEQTSYLKNVIFWAPIELLNGAVAFRYERYLKQRHSVGLHTSFYLYGYNSYILDLGYNENSFNGIKAIPFYRYYLKGIKVHGIYLEGKIPIGYFNFSKLFYAWMNYDTSKGIDIEHSFWTAGISASIGVSFNLPKSKHAIANISVGVQYFPLNAANTIYAPYNQNEMRKYYLHPNWWYISGPGSMLEIKFLVGGIF